MKKITRIIGVLVLVGGFSYGFYHFLMKPTGYTTSTSVVEAFMNDLDIEHCEDYFVKETVSVCEQFVTSLDGITVSVIDVSGSGNNVTVTMTLNDIETSFVFTVVTEEVTGLRGILTKSYYVIDTLK